MPLTILNCAVSSAYHTRITAAAVSAHDPTLPCLTLPRWISGWLTVQKL